MDLPIHLIVRVFEDGKAYATSPQAPGFLFGRNSLDELHKDLDEALSFHFDSPGPFKVVEHRERSHEIDGCELVTRIALDKHQTARMAVYDRIGRALGVPEQANSLLSAVTNKVGEAVYVCALPSDTVGWLIAQLDPRGDAFTAALPIAEEMLFGLPVAIDDGTRPTWQSFSDGPQTQLSEIMQRSPIVTPPQVTGLQVC